MTASAPAGDRVAATGGLLATALMWGLMVPGTAQLLPKLGYLGLPAIRYVITLPALVLLLYIIERSWPRLRGLPWLRLLKLGAAMAGFGTLYALGIRLSSPVVASIVLSSGPLTAALLVWLIYRRAPTAKFYGAVLLCIAGSYIAALAGPPGARPADAPPGLGELLIVGSSLSWQWYSLKAQEWLGGQGLSQLHITTLTVAACGALLVFACCVALLLGFELPDPVLNGSDIGMLLAISVGGTGIAIVLWNFGASRLGVPMAALYANLTPLFSFMFLALLGTSITWGQIGGGLLALAGVVFVQLPALGRARP